MALNTLTVLLVAMLLLVAFQDLKNRTIHVALPTMILGLALTINFQSKELNFKGACINVIFVLINMVGLVVYYSLKNKTVVNPIDTYIGLGDIVFFLAVTPLFTLKPFILFFVLGSVFSLILHKVLLVFKEVKTIPLAGCLALFLVINIALKDLINVDFLF